jgi:hypothetical protein
MIAKSTGDSARNSGEMRYELQNRPQISGEAVPALGRLRG